MRWDTRIDFERRTIWPGFKAGGKNRAMPIPMTDTARKGLTQAHATKTCDDVVERAGEQVGDIKRALKADYARDDQRRHGSGSRHPAHCRRFDGDA